tara:strand:- start:6 stop:170 length:165 start_codon:yes stop_codon:yes gene_type:complete
LTYDLVVKYLDSLKLDYLSIYGWCDGATMALIIAVNKKKIKNIISKTAIFFLIQ